MKVRVGSLYRYKAAGFDLFDPKCQIAEGTTVRVKTLPNA